MASTRTVDPESKTRRALRLVATWGTLALLLAATVLYGRAVRAVAVPELGERVGVPGLTARFPAGWAVRRATDGRSVVLAAADPEEAGRVLRVRAVRAGEVGDAGRLLRLVYEGAVQLPAYAGLRGHEIDAPRPADVAGRDGASGSYLLVDGRGYEAAVVSVAATPTGGGIAVLVEVVNRGGAWDGRDGLLARAVGETVEVGEDGE